jgi:aminoglycoside phosphotransferase family enzyme/predicted kinase
MGNEPPLSGASLPAALQALLDPRLHGCDPASVRLCETHASWVVLAGERAYKVKKPVAFAFLDQRSLAARRSACFQELALDRPFAPAIYLAVRALVPDAAAPAGMRLTDADAEGAVEYAVEMRRFDPGETLAGLLASGRLTDERIGTVGRRLAELHGAAPAVADAPTTPATALSAALALLHRNVEELLALLPAAEDRAAVLAQARGAGAWAAANAALLAQRAADGRVRELHGDLRAEHVLPGPPVQLVDGLEFNAEWRRIDVADELAFLTMDLTALGAAPAAAVLLRAYRDAGGDPGPPALIAFHAVYRAQVRAKVALLQARREETVRLLAVAERFAWRLRLPLTLIVCGPAASGKSTLAAELAARSGRELLATDPLRKRLHGVAGTDRLPADAYDAAANAAVHAALGRAAAAAGDGAVVDATFRRRADRDAFFAALGASRAATAVVVALELPTAVLAERAARRLADPGRVSDAGPEQAAAQALAFEPLDELAAERVHPLRGDRPTGAIVDALAAALDAAQAPPPADAQPGADAP